MRVGWIGLGQIGEPMAARVLAAGHQVAGFVRPGRDRSRLTAAGARLADNLADAVCGAEVVVVALFDDAQLRELLLQEGGLAALSPGAVLAVHTTGAPSVVEALASARPDVDVLDATFSGTAADAAAGRIRLFLGGADTAIARARPVLAAYCDPILPIGPVGAARRLKLINNLLFAAQVSLAAEALQALERMGVAKGSALPALRISSGGSFALEQFARGPTEQVLAGLARYLDKDVDAAREAAAAEGLELPLLSAAGARWGLG